MSGSSSVIGYWCAVTPAVSGGVFLVLHGSSQLASESSLIGCRLYCATGDLLLKARLFTLARGAKFYPISKSCLLGSSYCNALYIQRVWVWGVKENVAGQNNTLSNRQTYTRRIAQRLTQSVAYAHQLFHLSTSKVHFNHFSTYVPTNRLESEVTEMPNKIESFRIDPYFHCCFTRFFGGPPLTKLAPSSISAIRMLHAIPFPTSHFCLIRTQIQLLHSIFVPAPRFLAMILGLYGHLVR